MLRSVNVRPFISPICMVRLRMPKLPVPDRGAVLQRHGAPIFSLDYKAPFSRFHLLALLTWPEDREYQGYAIATYGAQLIAFIDAKGTRAIAQGEFSKTIAEAAAELGVASSVLLSMPIARFIAEQIARDATNMRGRLEDELLKPVGGMQTLADAPGSKVLREAVQNAMDGPVRNVGYLLLLIARMDKLHLDLKPSLNRAVAVAEATCAGPGWPGAKDRTLHNHWAALKTVAPLAAALWCWADRRPATVSRDDWFLSAFTTEHGVKTVLQLAKWFRRYAITFSVSGAKSSLLDPAVTVDYDVNVPELAPTLFPLSPSEVKVALGYHARTQKGAG